MKWLRDIAIFGAGCCFGAAGLIVILMVGFVVRDHVLSARPLFATAMPTLSSSEPLMVPHPSKTMEVVPAEPVPPIVSTEPQSTLAMLPTTIVLQTIEPTPTATLPPTATPPPTPTLEPAAALNANVRNALGESNRDLPRVASVEYSTPLNIINVTWALNDSWTTGYIKIGAQMDAAKILKAVHESGIVFDFINLTATMELEDAFGQSSESPVAWYTVEYETLQRIDWQDEAFVDVVLYQRIDEIADSVKYYPTFQE